MTTAHTFLCPEELMDFGIFMDFFSTKGLTQNEVFKEAFELIDLAEET